MAMKIEQTEIGGLVILTPERFQDDRGWFSESWNSAVLKDAGIDLHFVQDNHSFCSEAGTLRGLHYQAPPRAQDKLVRCTRGAILDAAVDVRVGSPTYGQWLSVELTADNARQLLVPKGFLHGFATLTANTEVQYKVTELYDGACDGQVRWDSLGIDWKIGADPKLSEKDRQAPSFDNWTSPFFYGEKL
jgi:dTDP-4-dehydrorhamnose 3,5-epimerase